jgi:polyhydroxybutyrate depolymerase
VIYVTPIGIKNSKEETFWKATDACCDIARMGWPDALYIANIIKEVSERVPVDSKRVYILGHSNGGFMAHRMACDHSHLIAGIVSIAGVTWDDITKCKPSEPVHILQIHGIDDPTILYDGGRLRGVTYPSAEGTVERWSTLNQCDALSITADTPSNLDLI